jgi:hypothetical protein
MGLTYQRTIRALERFVLFCFTHLLLHQLFVLFAAHAHMHTCTHAHMHTCTHAHMHTCIHAHAQSRFERQLHAHSPEDPSKRPTTESAYLCLPIACRHLTATSLQPLRTCTPPHRSLTPSYSTTSSLRTSPCRLLVPSLHPSTRRPTAIPPTARQVRSSRRGCAHWRRAHQRHSRL